VNWRRLLPGNTDVTQPVLLMLLTRLGELLGALLFLAALPWWRPALWFALVLGASTWGFVRVRRPDFKALPRQQRRRIYRSYIWLSSAAIGSACWFLYAPGDQRLHAMLGLYLVASAGLVAMWGVRDIQRTALAVVLILGPTVLRFMVEGLFERRPMVFFLGASGVVLAAMIVYTAALHAQRIARESVLRRQADVTPAAVADLSLAKLRFLATASHDLRQPVHAIGLFVGALREEVHEGRARYLVDRLDRSMSGIDELFNRLLDMARLDAGTIEPQVSVFPLAPLMQTLETRFSPMAQQRGLRLRVRPAPSVHVRTDPALLIEMLMNLLSNALRYTLRGGVLVGVRRRGGRALIQVWDTGVGIAEADRHAIFEEFVQVGGPARDRRQGLGLGLAIVRRLGGLLGCPVAVRSRPGRGSVFELSLPAASPAARVPASAQAADADALQGMLILVVDDELDILIGMEALLASWGCFVIVARSVDEARAHLIEAERFPDAVVTDHRLAGDSTSADVAGVVSELVPIRVPVVVLSADAGTSLDRMARERGWSLLSKPVSPQRLRSLLVELTRPAPTSA